MDNKIAFIIPSTPVCATVSRVLTRLGYDYPVYALSTKNAVEQAMKLISGGTRLIVSHGLTYHYMRQRIKIPMMELPFSGLEGAAAIRQALQYSKRIIHMGTAPLNRQLTRGIEFLGFSKDLIAFYKLSDGIPLEKQAQEALDAGYEVIIGGFPTANYANEHGAIGIEFDIDEQVIETAIDNARSVLKNLSEEEEKHELINAIFRSVSDGLIAIDDERCIYNGNIAAELLLGHPIDDVIGEKLESALARNGVIDILRVGSQPPPTGKKTTHVVQNEVPVVVNGQPKGSVVSLRMVSEIQNLEYRIRKEVIVKGLIAKSTFDDIAGISQAINQLKDRAKTYAQYNSTILITGESGTGKELFAQSIHNASIRKSQPFVAINCATLPEHLIESELFGYVQGAFTGASKEGKMGLFEVAKGGTIFLDEISEIPLSMQSKLLRVIQEREIIRIGGDKIIPVNVRIICSSNRDLLELVMDKKFKDDLYYRLCVLDVHIPPLRDRREDISAISQVLLRRLSKRHGKGVYKISAEAMRAIEQMPLYGNVRELGNMLERMLILSDSPVLDVEALQRSGISLSRPHTAPANSLHDLGTNVKKVQRDAIIDALKATGGNKAAAARMLNIDPSTLWRKIKSLNIPL